MFPIEPFEILCNDKEEELLLREAFNTGWQILISQNQNEKKTLRQSLIYENSIATLIILSILEVFQHPTSGPLIEKIKKNEYLKKALQYKSSLNQLDFALGLFWRQGNELVKNNQKLLEDYFHPILDAYKCTMKYKNLFLNGQKISPIFEGEFPTLNIEGIEKQFNRKRNNKYINNIGIWLTNNDNRTLIQRTKTEIRHLLTDNSILSQLDDTLRCHILIYTVRFSPAAAIELPEPTYRIKICCINNEIILSEKLIYKNQDNESDLEASFIYKIFINKNNNIEGRVVSITTSTLNSKIRAHINFSAFDKYHELSLLEKQKNNKDRPTISKLINVLRDFINLLEHQQSDIIYYQIASNEFSDLAKNIFWKTIETTIKDIDRKTQIQETLYSSHSVANIDPSINPMNDGLNKMLRRNNIFKLLKEAIAILEMPLPESQSLYTYHRFYLIELQKAILKFLKKTNSYFPEINHFIINAFNFPKETLLENRAKEIEKILQFHQINSKKDAAKLKDEHFSDEFFSKQAREKTTEKILALQLIQNITIYLSDLSETIRFFLTISTVNSRNIIPFQCRQIETPINLSDIHHIKITPKGEYPHTIDPFNKSTIVINPKFRNSEHQSKSNLLIFPKSKQESSALIIPLTKENSDNEYLIHAATIQALSLPFNDVIAKLSPASEKQMSNIRTINYFVLLYCNIVEILKSRDFIQDPANTIHKLDEKKHDKFNIKNFTTLMLEFLIDHPQISVQINHLIFYKARAQDLIEQTNLLFQGSPNSSNMLSQFFSTTPAPSRSNSSSHSTDTSPRSPRSSNSSPK